MSHCLKSAGARAIHGDLSIFLNIFICTLIRWPYLQIQNGRLINTRTPNNRLRSEKRPLDVISSIKFAHTCCNSYNHAAAVPLSIPHHHGIQNCYNSNSLTAIQCSKHNIADMSCKIVVTHVIIPLQCLDTTFTTMSCKITVLQK